MGGFAYNSVVINRTTLKSNKYTQFMNHKVLRHLWTCLALVLFGALHAVDATAQTGVTAFTDGTAYRIKCGGSDNGASSAPYLYDDGGTVKGQTLSTSNLQEWIVTAVSGKTGYYTVQNANTKRYLVPVTGSEAATTSETSTEVYLKANTNTGTDEAWWNIFQNETSTKSYNYYETSKIGGWEANNGKSSTLSGSEWKFVPISSLLGDGESFPEAGETIYRIVNNSSSSLAVYETGGSLSLIDYTNSDNDNSFGQYWKLVSQTDGTIALQNLLTGNYVQSLNGTKDATYKTGTDAYGFTIAYNANYSSTYKFDIRDTETLGFNCATNRVCSWTFYDGSSDANSLWMFRPVTLTEAQQTALATAQAAYKKEAALDTILIKGKVRIRTARNATTNSGYFTDAAWYITDNGSTEKTQTLTSGDAENQQIWIIEAQSGGGYTFRNLATGKYLDSYNSSTSAKTLYVRYYPSNGTDEYYVNISANSDFSGDGNKAGGGAIHAQGDGHAIVPWEPSAGTGSNWTFESVEMTDYAVREIFDERAGIESSLPTEATYVKLNNIYTGGYITDNTSKKVTTDAVRSKDASQVWKLIPVSGSDGYFQLQNALTEQYAGYAEWNSQIYSQSSEASSTSGSGFLVQRVTTSRFESHFTFVDPAKTSCALHSSNGNLITWSPSASASMWRICATDMTDDEIATQRTNVSTIATNISNAATDYEALQKFFDDALCTQLKSDYASLSDDEFTSKLTEAGVTSTTLQAIALKVKNNTWGTWEKTFRVRKAEPYANPDTWENILKIGNRYTNLTNPTGIWAKPYEVQYVFVGTDIPEGATLKLKSVPSAANQGYEVATLSKGLNAFYVNSEGAYYIDYVVETSADDDSKKLADYDTLDIRIEGGTVDGYFDATIDEIGTNAAWTQMNTDGLFQKGFIALKGTRFTFQYFTDWAKEIFNQTGHVRELVDFWDWMLRLFHKEMGLDDYYDRWNCMDGFYHVNSGLYATTYGIYYADKNILNYDNLVSGKGDLWGPAHETGHNHQSLINIIGTTEISNNLFSQIAVHRNGVTSTRLNGRKFKDVADLYAAGTSWHDYNIWDRNTLYLKLYLYYEVAGYKPTFIRDLFTALRKDPCTKSTNESNPTPASDDFLKFAVKCCDVAQEDLSEFFQAYGFFVPFEKRCIGDYANYWTYCTQDMIDEAKAKMQAYAKPKGNILFIENHIKHEPAQDHDGNYLYDNSGNLILRTDYSDEDAVGKCGDIGSYSDYAAGNYADGYAYTVKDDTVTVTGNGGAVGYKVYDSEGNLLYFSNLNTFGLPESVLTKLGNDLSTMVVKIAQPDGTDVALPNPSASVYTLKVYHADALTDDKSNTVYTDGTASTLPVLTGNALAFIQPSTTKATLPETLTQAQNVVDATDETAPVAYNVVLTDKADYYTPSAFTTTTLTYSRSNTEGWNSVCLPFAVTAEDFGAEARLETLTALTETDGTVTLHFSTPAADPEAGTACLVYCPEGTETWSLTKSNATLAANPVSTTIDGYSLNGSFVNTAIGAGHYKLNATGTAMGVTTDAGSVTAFRCYVSPLSEAASIRSLAVKHGDGTVSRIGEVVSPSSATPAIYDLTGRKVAKPAKGELYIVNGHKVIF